MGNRSRLPQHKISAIIKVHSNLFLLTHFVVGHLTLFPVNLIFSISIIFLLLAQAVNMLNQCWDMYIFVFVFHENHMEK